MNDVEWGACIEMHLLHDSSVIGWIHSSGASFYSDFIPGFENTHMMNEPKLFMLLNSSRRR